MRGVEHACALPAARGGRQFAAHYGGASGRFFDLPKWQIFVRSSAIADRVPILVLHDAPRGGRRLEPLYRELVSGGLMLLADLPGCGESDGLPGVPQTLADEADVMAQVLRERVGRSVAVYGVGLGSAVCTRAQSATPPTRGSTATQRDATRERRRTCRLAGRLAPPLELCADGSHRYRTWLMLRDTQVRWPWHDRRLEALRRQPTSLDVQNLHDWTCEFMSQWQSYSQLIEAAAPGVRSISPA